jgi:signal transduction histidine kinase
LMLDEFSLDKDASAKTPEDSLQKISTAAQEIIRSLDENVWAVNAGNDTLPHLIDYIGHFAADFLGAAGVRCRMDLPNDPPALPLSAEVRHNLFLAVKEALTNAVRHAHATEIRLRAAIDDGSLTLTVEDNGTGFEAEPTSPSADGLRNIRQRMDALGGKFDLRSSRNSGTGVTLVYFFPTRK